MSDTAVEAPPKAEEVAKAENGSAEEPMETDEGNTNGSTATTEEENSKTVVETLKENLAKATNGNGNGVAKEEETTNGVSEDEEMKSEEENGKEEEEEKKIVNGEGNGKHDESTDSKKMDEDDFKEDEESKSEEKKAEDKKQQNGNTSGNSSVVAVSDDDDDDLKIIGASTGPNSSAANTNKGEEEIGDISDFDDDDDEDDDEGEDDEDDESDEVEEVIDDDEDGSDIVELDGDGKTKESAGQKTPTVVTIDDVQTLHKIAAAKQQPAAAVKKPESDNGVTIIDTSTILSGKMTSGITITPASRPKNLVNNIPNLPPGVTLSQRGGSSPNLSSLAGNSGEEMLPKDWKPDPNLKDDMKIVEMPSFIIPYLYEAPAKESFESFRAEVKKLVDINREKEREAEEKWKRENPGKKKPKEKKKKKRKKARPDDDDEGEDEESDDDYAASEDEASSSEEDIDSDDELYNGGGGGGTKVGEDDFDTNAPQFRAPTDNFFETCMGKFFHDLGMNLVQEVVQTNLLRDQMKRAKKDKSAQVMHAIRSLKNNLESSKEGNEPFKLKQTRCKFCSFKTESAIVMAHHLETPHMKDNNLYRCNFCPYSTKMPADVLSHMGIEHGVRSRLERAPANHQCPQCPFEDNGKGKLTRHKTGCDKRFRPEMNLSPGFDWEAPAKIPKPPQIQQFPGQRAGSAMSQQQLYQNRLAMTGPVGQLNPLQLSRQHQMQQQQAAALQQQARVIPPLKGGYSRGGGHMMNRMGGPANRPNQRMPPLNMKGVSISPANRGGRGPANRFNNQQQHNNILSSLGANSSVTIQSINKKGGRGGFGNTPSGISITPLSGGTKARPSPSGSRQPNQRPPMGASAGSGAQQGKGNFVICEICDGYIKDLTQLRNHMQWIHKVKIHPKMIHNRPPLNCQKCQFRFFTDQGLERHLLGSHGLVTASMQDMANKGQDAGRCPVCGKVYQWKLLNHVAKDHGKTLKPAHLSYKCTLCTATFGQYKLFEVHVYTEHNPKAKKKPAAGTPEPASSAAAKPAGGKKRSPDVIDLDDDDSQGPQSKKVKAGDNSVTVSSTASSSATSSAAASPAPPNPKAKGQQQAAITINNNSDINEDDSDGDDDEDEIEEVE